MANHSVTVETGGRVDGAVTARVITVQGGSAGRLIARDVVRVLEGDPGSPPRSRSRPSRRRAAAVPFCARRGGQPCSRSPAWRRPEAASRSTDRSARSTSTASSGASPLGADRGRLKHQAVAEQLDVRAQDVGYDLGDAEAMRRFGTGRPHRPAGRFCGYRRRSTTFLSSPRATRGSTCTSRPPVGRSPCVYSRTRSRSASVSSGVTRSGTTRNPSRR